MHFRKFVASSISLLCVLMLLVIVTPYAYAASGSLLDGKLSYSTADSEGTVYDSDYTEYSNMEATWAVSGTSITGSVTPGSTYKSGWFGSKTYYPDKYAKSVLTLTNNSGEEAVLSCAYSTPANSGSVTVSSNASVDGNSVSATLKNGESIQITLATSSSVSSGSADKYTTTTTISGLTLTSLTADIQISLKSVEGGSFSVFDGTETKNEGESFTNPMTAEYTLTASAPDNNYHFDGWAFNGVKQSNTSLTISGVVFKGNTEVEAVYTLDPLYAITTSADGTPKDDLVSINSRFVHQSTNEKKDTKESGNNTVPYYTITDNSVASGFDTYYTPSKQWVQSGSSIVVSGSGTATGEYESSGARSWAYANVVSDVIQIYAKDDCVVSFNYNNSTSLDSDATLKDNTATPGIHIYESSSASEKITTVLSKSTTYSEANGSINHTLAKGKYLYIYTNGHFKGGKLMLSSGSVKITYSLTSTISNFSVKSNDIKYTQSTTFKDNEGNVLQGGKLTLNGTSYTSDVNGNIAVASLPAGQSMQITSVTAPTNYVFLGWEVNDVMHCTPTYEYTLNADTVVNPIFVPRHVTYDVATNKYQYKNVSGTVVDLNGQYIARNNAYTEFYTSLADAFSKTNEVVLLGNLTINGDFEIPDGKVLVVPGYMNDAVNKDSSGIYNPYATTKIIGSGAYATLTVNGNLTVNGALIVSGQQTASNGGPGGSYGLMTIPAGYTVTVSENKALYGYGLVNGAGEIIVKNGAHVHELCEVKDIPHPMLMSDLVQGGGKNDKVMPFNSFYINTIEAKTTYKYGSSLHGHLSLSYDSITQSSFPAIAPSGSILVVNSGTVTKYFDSAAGKITFRANEGSDVETGSFKASMSVHLGTPVSAELESQKYYVPMSAGYQFVIAGALTMNHDYKMLPGSNVNVLKGGKLTIGENANMVFYRLNDYDYRRNTGDADNGIGFSAYGYPINMSRHSGFSVSNIGSAKLNVDGEVIVQGGLYVTEQLIAENTETESKNAFKNYTHYENGYNYLTGTGRIDMTAARTSAPVFKEQLHVPGGKSANTASVAIVPIKGLTAEATADTPDQYVSLTGVSKGMTNDAGLNVWSADPCADGHTTEKTETVAATCTTYGTNAYWTCTVCGDHFSDEACTVVITDLEAWLKTDISENGGLIPATGHDYTDVETVYTWNDSHTSCVASRTCKVCYVEGGEPTETVSTTNISAEVTTPATCAVAGVTTYTATFEAPEGAEEDAWVPAATSKDVENILVDTVNGHTYGEGVVTTPATCTTDGEKTYTCSVCTEGTEGHTKTEAITKLGHSETDSNNDHICDREGCEVAISTCKDNAAHTAAKAATCKEAGNIEYWTCSVCKKMYSNADCTTEVTDVTIAIDKNNHANIVTDEAVDVTCTTDGKTEGSHCEACGTVIVAQETVAAVGHKYNVEQNRTAATCMATGSVVWKCANCDSTKTETLAIDSSNHTGYGETTYQWSSDYSICTATRTCTCGHKETTDSKSSVTSTVAASDTVAGSKTHTAPFEGVAWASEQSTDEEIPALGCNYSDKWSSNETYHWHECSTCGARRDEAAHADDNNDHKCDICEYVMSSCSFTAQGALISAGDCVTEAEYKGKCAVCGAESDTVTVKGEVNSSVHSFNNKASDSVKSEATCIAAAVYWAQCDNCSAISDSVTVNGTEVDSTNHVNIVDVPAKAATCTSTGLTAGEKCESCGVFTVEQTVTDKLEHSYTWETTTAATCVAKGVETGTCKCGDTTTRDIDIDPDAHDLKTVAAQDATCTQIGWAEYEYCQREGCNYSTYEVIEKLPHDYSDKWTSDASGHWHQCNDCTAIDEVVTHTEEIIPGKAATCTEDGMTDGVKCSVCEYVIKAQEVIPKASHNYQGKVADEKYLATPATCINEATYYKICVGCNDINYNDTFKSGSVNANNHVNTTEHAQTPATCTEVGYTEGVYCNDCEKYVSGHTEIPATNHKNAKTINVKEATCTVEGYTGDFYCEDCKTTIQKGDTIKVKPHTAVHHEAVGKTCTTDGSIEHWTCSVCSKYFSDAACTVEITAADIVVAKGHELTFVAAKDATCTESGNVAYYACDDCGKYFEDESAATEMTEAEWFIKALDHNWGEWATTTEPKCEAAGEERRDCTRCDAFETNVLAAIDHKWNAGEVTTDPTCSAEGVKTFTCLNDAAHTKTEPVAIDSNAHDWNDGEVTTDPTCTEAGVKTYTCKHNASHTYTEPVSNLGHSFGTWTTTLKPTCTVNGQERRECTRCDAFETNVLTAPGHKLSETVIAPTCTERGYTLHKCSECDYEYMDSYTDATDHDYELTDSKDATCTEDGYKTYTCKNDNSHTYTETVKAFGHNYNTVTTSPSHVSGGYDTHTCDTCGHSYVDNQVDALGHEEQTVPGKAATCTETGLTDGVECATCGTVIVEQEVIPALGHDKVSHEAKAPTCTEIGWDAYETCSRCDYTTYVEKPALGHNTEGVIAHKDATCTETGVVGGTYCTRCNEGKAAAENVITALGHDEVAHEAQAPTCTEIGWDAYETCSRCDYTTYVEKPATGHVDTTTVCTPVDGVKQHTVKTTCSCGEVTVDTTATCVDSNSDNKCDNCGRPFYVVTIDDRTIEGDNKATTSLVPAGKYVPGEIFTVTCAKACVVAISYDSGESYEELSCTAVPGEGNENTYQFTIPADAKSDFKIGIVLRGDALGEGAVNAFDATRILRYTNPGITTYNELDALTKLAADATLDGTVNVFDATRILRYTNPGITVYNEVAWKLN